VLESELANSEAAAQSRESARAGYREAAVVSAPAGRRRNGPESKLLCAMLAAPEWIAKAREEISPSLLESARLREVFEALVGSDTYTDQMPAGLSPDAASAWSYLKESAQERSTGDAATIYDRAAQILRARPYYREMDAVTDPGEKRRRRADLRARFPAADAWYEYQKAASRESRAVRRSRGS
jgi:hypothetical protein